MRNKGLFVICVILVASISVLTVYGASCKANGALCASKDSCCSKHCFLVCYGTTTCTPNCGSKVCGDDGCNGVCGLGSCPTGLTCSGGQCKSSCVPNCVNKECGDDGCGGVCGTCATGKTCVDSQPSGKVCCLRTCSLFGYNCGSDGCGGTCGTCSAGQTCVSGKCSALCEGKSCAGSADCCSGYICGSGKCVPCKKVGEVCQSVGECCIATCQGGKCLPTPSTCIASGQACTSTLECCSGLACLSGKCKTCTSDCVGKCGGASDGCSGSCTAACPSGQHCAGQVCYGCTDTDGGKIYDVQGTVDTAPGAPGGEATDYCQSGTQLLEYYCTADGSNGGASSVFYNCPSGVCCKGACCSSGQTCVNDKCVSNGVCSETDGGIDYLKQGTTTSAISGTFTDYCPSWTQLAEYSCLSDGTVTSTPFSCPSLGDYMCTNGACVCANVCDAGQKSCVNSSAYKSCYYNSSVGCYKWSASRTNCNDGYLCSGGNCVYCAGCISGWTCNAGNTNSQCGSGGLNCISCPSGQTCSAGKCVSKAPSITVLSPNGGEVWGIGKTYEIKWTTTNWQSNDVAIALIDSKSKTLFRWILGGTTLNDGVETWQVPNDVEMVPGDYLIQASYTSGTPASDVSNAPFNIVAAEKCGKCDKGYTCYQGQCKKDGSVDVTEQVTCYVANWQDKIQTCHTTDTLFYCQTNQGVCTAKVFGLLGKKLTWTSPCDDTHSYDTLLDGTNEQIKFTCTSTMCKVDADCGTDYCDQDWHLGCAGDSVVKTRLCHKYACTNYGCAIAEPLETQEVTDCYKIGKTCVNAQCATIPCSGCVKGGLCYEGNSIYFCGTGGAFCQTCPSGSTCIGGKCVGGCNPNCLPGYKCWGYQCVSKSCGNGVIDAYEVCDGANLNGQSCNIGHGYGNGLSCMGNCTLNISMCSSPICYDSDTADNVKVSGQCKDFHYVGGYYIPYTHYDFCPYKFSLNVTQPSCAYDYKTGFYGCLNFTVACPTAHHCEDGVCVQGGCNSNIIDVGEECDLTDWGKISGCSDLGFGGGTLSCGADCKFDTSACALPTSPSEPIAEGGGGGAKPCVPNSYITCGNCGRMYCKNGQYSGTCEAQGACKPGDRKWCSGCNYRTCGKDCKWPTQCTAVKDCTSGTTMTCGTTSGDTCGTKTCTNCVWGSCVEPCAYGATTTQGCGKCSRKTCKQINKPGMKIVCQWSSCEYYCKALTSGAAPETTESGQTVNQGQAINVIDGAITKSRNSDTTAACVTAFFSVPAGSDVDVSACSTT